MIIKDKKILVTLSKLTLTSGVSSFWNALFKSFNHYEDINFKTLEIGGHGYNLLGPIIDQWRFNKALKSDISFACLNPSLINRSFFRDGMFAKQLAKKGIPFVVFFHGWETNFQDKVDEKYKSFFLKSFGKAEKIFVLSEDFKNKILEWGYTGKTIVELTNVDASLIDNFSYSKKLEIINNQEVIKILFLARIIKEKGIFELIDAVEKLSIKRKNLELIIAGDGADFLRLKEKVAKYKNIRITGDVQGEDKINLFKESHLYILPSYTEGLPISVLEAMLFGLPVITTKVGGLKYFIEEGKMGYLVKPKNTNELIEKIEYLIDNHEKMVEISKYNFEYAQNHLTNDEMAKRLYIHFKELLS